MLSFIVGNVLNPYNNAGLTIDSLKSNDQNQYSRTFFIPLFLLLPPIQSKLLKLPINDNTDLSKCLHLSLMLCLILIYVYMCTPESMAAPTGNLQQARHI